MNNQSHSQRIFKDLVLPDGLKRLGLLLDNPELIPPFTLFYGEPATGKTTVANRIASQLAGSSYYIPCNETGLSNGDWDKIQSFDQYSLERDETKPLEKVYIIDEFHNCSSSKQDRFKTIYDTFESCERLKGVKFIFIMNLEAGGRRVALESKLSHAMRSRMVEKVNFDVRMDEVESMMDSYRLAYGNLDDLQIRGLMPDHRRLQRENLLATLG